MFSLRNEDMLKNFLNNLFRLMPTEVLQYSEGKSKSVLEMFLKKPDIHMDGKSFLFQRFNRSKQHFILQNVVMERRLKCWFVGYTVQR